MSGPAFFSLRLFRGERFSVEVHQIVGAGTAARDPNAPRPRPVFVINIGPEGTGLAGFIDATSKVCALFALWPWARHTIKASNTVCVLRGMVGAMARSQQFTCPEFDAAGLIYSLRKSVAPKTHLMLPGSLLGRASGLKTYPLRDIGRK